MMLLHHEGAFLGLVTAALVSLPFLGGWLWKLRDRLRSGKRIGGPRSS